MIDTTTPPAGASPRGIAADLRRLADTPGHQLTDAYRQSLRQLADWVTQLDQPAEGAPMPNLISIPIEPTPRETGDQIRRLTREVRDVYRELARRTEATAELEVVAGGLEPEQEIVARAVQAAATALGPAIAAAVEAERGPISPDDFASGRDLLVSLTEVFAELIRTGARP